MTTILAGLTWATERGRLVRRFRPRGADEEEQLRLWFLLAVEQAHETVGRRDFTTPPMPTQEWIDGVGLTEADPAEVLAAASIPEAIREGVARYIAALKGTEGRKPGVVSEGNQGGNVGIDLYAARHPGDLPLMAALAYWRPYALDATTHGGEPAL